MEKLFVLAVGGAMIVQVVRALVFKQHALSALMEQGKSEDIVAEMKSGKYQDPNSVLHYGKPLLLNVGYSSKHKLFDEMIANMPRWYLCKGLPQAICDHNFHCAMQALKAHPKLCGQALEFVHSNTPR